MEEEGLGSLFGHQQTNAQSSNINSLNAPFCLGQINSAPSCMNPCSNFITTNGILPSSGMPQAKASEPHEPRGWFYCLPRFRQAFAPVLNSGSPYKDCQETRDPVASDTQSAPRRFLVFDQSGDQTTLIYSSGISDPVKNLPSWCPQPSNAFTMYKDTLDGKKDASNPSNIFSDNGFNELAYEIDVQNEMHEDTEELDALLYSDDDDDYSEDEDEASTGHSPDSNNKRVWIGENREEVASSARPTKKQRLSKGSHDDVLSLMDTASSVESHNRCLEYEESAKSSCGNNNNVLGESDSVSADQQSKIEKIRRTISIIESIIPDRKDRDSIAVIDDAIQYLRSLKDKAKVLGLDGQ
nr:bHLH18 [Bupleurum chinense]